MAYTRNPTWQDHPDTSTPITAAKLENIEQGIVDAHAAGIPAGGTDGQVLTKTSSANYATAWETPAGGGASTLDDLTDVDTTGQTSGDVLKYNGTSWVADAASAGTVSSTDISDSTAVGRSVLTAANAAAARTALGAGTSSFSGAYADLSGKPTLGTAAAEDVGDFAAASHSHPVGDLTATGTASSSTFLRGDGTWAAPTGTSAPDASTSTKGIVQLTNHLGGTATAPTVRTASTTQTGIVELATNTEATTGTDTARAVTPSGVKAVVDARATDYATAAQGAKADSALQVATAQPINAQSGAYTLVAGDAGKMVKMTLGSAADLTVPANVFTAGQRVDIADRGTHRVTVVAGAGMTVNPPPNGTLVMEGRYSVASLFFWSATEADLIGLVAAP